MIKKNHSAGKYYNFAVSGGIFAELLLDEKIAVDTGDKKRRVKPIDTTETGDELLDHALTMLKEAKKTRSLKYWISKLAGLRNLKHRAAEGLCKKGILGKQEKKVLWISKRTIYPEINPSQEKKLKSRMEAVLFSDRKDVDPAIGTIISLAYHTGLLELHFDKKELKQRKERIKKVSEGSISSAATKEAIEALQAAILAATIAASASAAASAASH